MNLMSKIKIIEYVNLSLLMTVIGLGIVVSICADNDVPEMTEAEEREMIREIEIDAIEELNYIPGVLNPEEDKLAGTPFTEPSEFDGIDISAHQGRIFWDSLKANAPGLQFVIIREAGKWSIDSLYVCNVKLAKKNGLKVGTYHFFVMHKSVDEQFNTFASMVQKEDQDLRPVIDVEDQSMSGDSMTNLHVKDSVMKMARLLEKHYGCKPIIYSGQNFYNKYLNPYFNKYPLWIANYRRQPSIPGAVPILWQRSDRGHLCGIWKEVDLNKFINGKGIEEIKVKK